MRWGGQASKTLTSHENIDEFILMMVQPLPNHRLNVCDMCELLDKLLREIHTEAERLWPFRSRHFVPSGSFASSASE